MDNIRIYINDEEVGVYDVQDTGASFSWTSKLIDDINAFTVVSSGTVTLPLSDKINRIFKSPSLIDNTDSLSNREYYTIIIKWNDTLVVTGYIKLQRTVILINDEFVEFTIEPKEKSWIEQFRDFKLTQLDYTLGTSQSHSLTYANIVASESFLNTREYVYAPIDIAEVGRVQVIWIEQSGGATFYWYYGTQISATTFIGNTYGFDETQLNRTDELFTDVVDTFWNARGVYKAQINTIVPLRYVGQVGYIYSKDIDYWQISDFYPSVRHYNIIKRCFDRIGYNVDIPNYSDYFLNKYNFVVNVEQLNKFESERSKLKVRVQDGGFSFTKTAAKSWIVPFRNISENYSTPSTNFTDTNSNNSVNIDANTNLSKYTVTETCILGFKWNYSIKHELVTPVTVASSGNDVTIHIKQYDSGNTLRRTISYDIVMEWKKYDYKIWEGSLEAVFLMDTGDYVLCEIEYKDLWLNGATITIKDSNTLETKYFQGGNYKGKLIRLNEYLPDRSAYDYIKDLCLINNWEIYTNDKTKTVYFVREDYKLTGKTIDYTKKLDISSEVELSEVGLLHPLKYYFNWKKDKNDKTVNFIELMNKEGLSDTYKQEEIEMACRYAVGTIDNLNLFAKDKTEIKCDIYSASLDKWTTDNCNFQTIEMASDEYYPEKPRYRRGDYEPRYIQIDMGSTLESSGVGGVTSIDYRIGLAANHTTYPKASFQIYLFFGGTYGLLASRYARRIRAIKYGWILKGSFNLTENDVNTFLDVYADNDFRSEFTLQLKGIVKGAELLKVNEFTPAAMKQTEMEFLIYRG